MVEPPPAGYRATSLRLLLASGLLAAVGCKDTTHIEGIGQFGKPISIATNEDGALPRLARSHEVDLCPGPQGGCTSYCAAAPADCPAGSCMGVLIDSGSPFTVLPADGFSLSRECTEVRAAGGLEADEPTAEALADAITRFRFEEVPVIRAPQTGAGGWEWEVGDDLATIHVGGVIGGNLLREFAVELRHQTGFDSTLAFYVNFPGSETILADQGRAHIGLQFPGQLAGRVLYDRCEIGPGIDCELEGIDIDPSDEVLVYESTRMVVDACVAPPVCGVHWSEVITDEPEDPPERECRLSPGGVLIEDECSQTDPGISASMLVATGIPGVVLFDDSALRILGDLTGLPSCADLPVEPALAVGVDACLDGDDADLAIAGWPTLHGLTRLKLRSLALVSGLSSVHGKPPCERLEARRAGLLGQCVGFAARGRPWRPLSDESTSLASSSAVVGEVYWTEEQMTPLLDNWLDLLVVPATAPAAIALRREIGSQAIELDGLVGSVLLADTDVVLDYTETEVHPGVRMTCLDPGAGTCVSIPACEVDHEAKGSGDYGRVSCCFGLPPELIEARVLEGSGDEAPRVEDTCCPALPLATRDELHAAGLCTGQYLP